MQSPRIDKLEMLADPILSNGLRLELLVTVLETMLNVKESGLCRTEDLAAELKAFLNMLTGMVSSESLDA